MQIYAYGWVESHANQQSTKPPYNSTPRMATATREHTLLDLLAGPSCGICQAIDEVAESEVDTCRVVVLDVVLLQSYERRGWRA